MKYGSCPKTDPLQKVSCSAGRSSYNSAALLEELHGSAEEANLFGLGPEGVAGTLRPHRTTCPHRAYSATAFASRSLKNCLRIPPSHRLRVCSDHAGR